MIGKAKIWGETYESEDSAWFVIVIAEIEQRDRESSQRKLRTLCLESDWLEEECGTAIMWSEASTSRIFIYIAVFLVGKVADFISLFFFKAFTNQYKTPIVFIYP